MAKSKDKIAQEKKLKKQKTAKVNELNRLIKNNEDIDEKVRRLKNAYNKINEAKDYILKQNLSYTYDVHYKSLKWKGQNHNKYKTKDSVVYEDLNRYHKDIDRILDDINRKIRDLKNAQDKNNGPIGWLRTQIRNIETDLVNLFN